MRVVVSANAWKNFLRRGKSHYAHEIVAALWGYETVEAFRVSRIHPMRVKAGRFWCTYDDEEISRQKMLAAEAGLKFLGTIHTHPHPDCDPSPSARDHIDSLGHGEKLMGIIHLWKDKNGRFKTDVAWWFPQRKIPFEVIDD